MYALANVRKFIDDNQLMIADRGEEIFRRAEACSYNGLISGGAIEEIMRDALLTREFHVAVMSNEEHIAIGLGAIRSADNLPMDISEVDNFSKVLELIREANKLLKGEWDKDESNHLASASYKALNALGQAISEKINGKESDEDYVLSRLLESFSRFADHYGISLEEALVISGFPVQRK